MALRGVAKCKRAVFALGDLQLTTKKHFINLVVIFSSVSARKGLKCSCTNALERKLTSVNFHLLFPFLSTTLSFLLFSSLFIFDPGFVVHANSARGFV